MHEQTICNRNSKIRKIKDLQTAYIQKEKDGEASVSFIHSFSLLWRGLALALIADALSCGPLLQTNGTSHCIK